MKKILATLALTCLLGAFPASAALSNITTVTSVKVLGSKWGNAANRGGFVFSMQSHPSGVSYFIVRPTDVALESLLALVLEARASAKTIQVEYDLVNGVEGDVKAIELMP